MTLLEAGLRALPALAAVLLLGRVLSMAFKKIGQPPVIGEVLAGILLGPSLLGVQNAALLLPPESAPLLKWLALTGVTLYMFRVGLALDTALVQKRLRATMVIAHTGIAAPLLFGALLGVPLYAGYAGAAATPLVFALFLGVALSITAFPVLARILADTGLLRHPLGQMALGCAAVGDVSAWCLLAAVTGMVSAQQSGAALMVLTGSAAYVLVMLWGLRPLLPRLCTLPTPVALTALLVLLALSASATHWLGLHASFGAFLLGALLPRDAAVTQQLDRGLEKIAFWLLPAFFAYAGMHTRLDLLGSWQHWGLCLVITLAASAGKIGGTWIGARASGERSRKAWALGALMNARGLMELIIINIGLQKGVIGTGLFSMLVLMAIVTTLMASPLFEYVYGKKARETGELDALDPNAANT